MPVTYIPLWEQAEPEHVNTRYILLPGSTTSSGSPPRDHEEGYQGHPERDQTPELEKSYQGAPA